MTSSFVAIGQLVTTFALAEQMVQAVVWALLDWSDQRLGLILTDRASLDRLCGTAVAVAREKLREAPEAVAQLKTLLQKVKALEVERNRRVHALWAPVTSDPTGLLDRIKFTHGRRLDFEPRVSPDDLNRLADDIFAVVRDLQAFIQQYRRPAHA